MRALVLCAAALLAACSERSPAAKVPVSDAAVTAPTTPAPLSSLPAPATLAGEWKVAGIDGQDLNEAYGIALSANDNEIWWEPRCAGMVRGYEVNGTAMRVGRAPSLGPPPAPGTPASAVCAIGLPPRLIDVFRALDSAKLVQRTPSNGIEISGGERSVLLFSQ